MPCGSSLITSRHGMCCKALNACISAQSCGFIRKLLVGLDGALGSAIALSKSLISDSPNTFRTSFANSPSSCGQSEAFIGVRESSESPVISPLPSSSSRLSSTRKVLWCFHIYNSIFSNTTLSNKFRMTSTF